MTKKEKLEKRRLKIIEELANIENKLNEIYLQELIAKPKGEK